MALTAAIACGQSIVEPKDRAKFNDIFDNAKGERLNCGIKTFGPYVDFGFRFELGYMVDCDIRQFDGVSGDVRIFLRVRPENGDEVVLSDRIFFPGITKQQRESIDLPKIHANFQFSGALAAGEGVYALDLLIFDNRERVYRHSWKAKAEPHGKEAKVDFSMRPDAIAALRTIPIPARPSVTKGTHLTVLMNAAPINPWSSKLRAWDRTFLLDSLSTLLRQLSYDSVRVVAFNLEQQREIFRQDDFSQSDMHSLSHALRNLELGTVSYNTLQRKSGWAELLLGLLHSEAQAEQPSDAVVFLGPTLRLEDKVPPELLASYQQETPPLFCVAYYPRVGADFPDSIQHLTSALKGKVFRIHTPGELAKNLDKLKHEIANDGAARTTRAAK